MAKGAPLPHACRSLPNQTQTHPSSICAARHGRRATAGWMHSRMPSPHSTTPMQTGLLSWPGWARQGAAPLHLAHCL